MLFKRIEPIKELAAIIECFWIIENDDPAPVLQKVIPDGFVEIIFHFGDPYRIQLNTDWQIQASSLLAGQIRNYFFLENTGKANILGVKLKPAALAHLYDISMHNYTDKVVDITTIPELDMLRLANAVHGCSAHDERIELINDYFSSLPSFINYKPIHIDPALTKIAETNGMVTVSELREVANVGERQLENLFKKYIGLSPKFFSRITRFNYIFQLAEQKSDNWTSLAYEAAYFDQSHFIRNFKSFTGENPSAYSFDERNMANFFLLKK